MAVDRLLEVNAGDVVAACIEAAGVEVVFGVASIHNLPMLDALMRRGAVRCVPARGEAGTVNMADAYARVRGGLGVAVTSTGTGAGNAAGALMEAHNAGTPLLHLTGQIATPFLDRGRGYIHEARDQLGMLQAVSKRAYRVWSPQTVLGTLRAAIAEALTPPCGPVSVEIPIDVQRAALAMPPPEELLAPVAPPPSTDEASLDAIAGELRGAKRPLLWIGGGARAAAHEARALADAGWAVVASTNGRGIVPDDHPSAFGAFGGFAAFKAFAATCDATLVVGSRLRGTDTAEWTLPLPAPLYHIDADPSARHRSYGARRFAVADARVALRRLSASAQPPAALDPQFSTDIAAARAATRAELNVTLGPYAPLVAALERRFPPGAPWVRDITVANSAWGNRVPALREPRGNVYALGGGIGQGLAMAIGAALAVPDRRTIALVGDGSLMLGYGELATLAQERANVSLIVMNNGGYGLIRHIQSTRYGARYHLCDLVTPDFQIAAASLGLPAARVGDAAAFERALDASMEREGPTVIEVDMMSFGEFGPPFSRSTFGAGDA